jgi:protein-tyrosine phosphatase
LNLNNESGIYTDMIKVLFVCLGNICRSPLAEGVFKAFILRNNLNNSILADSAGTAGYHIGSFPDKRSVKTAEEHGILLEHCGRKLSSSDFEEFDFIIAMDKNNYKDIISLQNESKGKARVFLFRDFDPAGKGDVPDPYHGTMKDFEDVYQMCYRTSENLLEFVQKNN